MDKEIKGEEEARREFEKVDTNGGGMILFEEVSVFGVVFAAWRFFTVLRMVYADDFSFTLFVVHALGCQEAEWTVDADAR